MGFLYVARSAQVQDWAADVGLTLHVFKIGVADDAEAVIAALNEQSFAGAADWKLVKKQAADGIAEDAALEKLAKKEKAVDGALYPRLRGASGMFKVKLTNVQTRMLVQRMMAGEEETSSRKPKVADIADYLIQSALG